jgi:hypothetical protein
MPNFKISIQGLDQLKLSLDRKELDRKLIPEIGLSVLKLHNVLKFAVKENYTIDKSLDTVLKSFSKSNVVLGTNLISAGLEYNYKPIDLSKFPYSFVPGPRGGKIHSVTIKRGSTKIVHGKSRQGGFVPRSNSGKVYRNAFGAQMFERIGRSRLPLRVLFGPSLSQMAAKMFDTNSNVARVEEEISQNLLNILDL